MYQGTSPFTRKLNGQTHLYIGIRITMLFTITEKKSCLNCTIGSWLHKFYSQPGILDGRM